MPANRRYPDEHPHRLPQLPLSLDRRLEHPEWSRTWTSDVAHMKQEPAEVEEQVLTQGEDGQCQEKRQQQITTAEHRR